MICTRQKFLAGLGLTALTLLAACDGKKAAEPAGAKTEALPDYYPADYGKIVEASRQETGLLVYSNVAEYNWRPIIEAFNKHYPWIKVATLDLGPGEMFERYYSENSAGQKTGDLIVNAAPDVWQRFIAGGNVAPYVSPETPFVPEWSKPAPGVYTASTDPMVIIYNKILLKPEEYPTGMKQLTDMVTKNPERFRNKITTYDATSHSFAYAIHWQVAHDAKPEGWPMLEKLGPLTRPTSAGATMLDKVTTGEFLIAYYTSGATTFSQLQQAGRSEVIGVVLPPDGTPIMPRGMAVTKAAKNPNSARLMLDFILSHEGQAAMGQGGMTPYRSDVSADQVAYKTHDSVVKEIGGEQNALIISYSPEMVKEHETFVRRWGALFKHK